LRCQVHNRFRLAEQFGYGHARWQRSFLFPRPNWLYGYQQSEHDDKGLLLSDGSGRGMEYFLPWQKAREDALFDLRVGIANGGKAIAISPGLAAVISPEPAAISPGLGPVPPELAPQYLDWDDLSPELQTELAEIAAPIRPKRRVSPEELQSVVLALCSGRFLGRRVLSHLLERDPDDLRKRVLTPMVQAKRLIPAFASTSNPKQAYMAAEPADSKE
jgi:hypothetical protein